MTKNSNPIATERAQIRGSGLLLTGRFIALAINFATQVSIVRHLSTTEYGAWAGALAAVMFCQVFATLSLQDSLARFVPIYYEGRQLAKLLGSIVLAFAVVAIASVLFIVPFHLFPKHALALVKNGPTFTLLLILIFLVPIEAIDTLVEALFASFSGARTIFIRKYLLGPALRFGFVVAIIVRHGSARLLALGYLTAAVLGVGFYGWSLLNEMRARGLLRAPAGGLDIPARELLGFTIPIMTTAMVNILNLSVAAMLLGYFKDPSQVAFYRAVYPAATLNQVVFQAFALLYTPSAARLFARKDARGIHSLYWRNALWMGMLSFPIFVVTFAFARPVTVLLFGSAYQGAATVLALLSLAHYASVAIGFNAFTLQVLGKVRYLTAVNLIAVVVNLAVNLALIPHYGAVGAAAGTLITMLAHNVLKQVALRRAGLASPGREFISFFALVGVSAGLLTWSCLFGQKHLALAVLLAISTMLVVFAKGARHLKLAETFPEALNMGAVRWLLAVQTRCSYLWLKALDAAVTVSVRPWRSTVYYLRCLCHPRSHHYDRVAALVRLADRMGLGLSTWLARRLLAFERLPFPAMRFKLLSYGYGATVFLANDDLVLKIYRLSLGGSSEEAARIAARCRHHHQVLAHWYNGNEQLIPPMQFLVLNGPLLGRTAAAGLQPYIGGHKQDLFGAFTEQELLTLAAEHPGFGRELQWFARRTIQFLEQQDCCLDMLGSGNVVVVINDGGIPHLTILDSGYFELQTLRERFPERLASLTELVNRLRSMLDILHGNGEPGWNEAPALVEPQAFQREAFLHQDTFWGRTPVVDEASITTAPKVAAGVLPG